MIELQRGELCSRLFLPFILCKSKTVLNFLLCPFFVISVLEQVLLVCIVRRFYSLLDMSRKGSHAHLARNSIPLPMFPLLPCYQQVSYAKVMLFPGINLWESSAGKNDLEGPGYIHPYTGAAPQSRRRFYDPLHVSCRM